MFLSRRIRDRVQSYRAAIEMIVESAAPYSIVLIGFIASGMNNLKDAYPQAILGPMTVRLTRLFALKYDL